MTTVVLPGSFASTITSRGLMTTTSAIFGSAAATCLMSEENCSSSPRPVVSVSDLWMGGVWARSASNRIALFMEHFLNVFVAAKHFDDGARGRGRGIRLLRMLRHLRWIARLGGLCNLCVQRWIQNFRVHRFPIHAIRLVERVAQ